MKEISLLSIEAGPKCSMHHSWCPVSSLGERVSKITPTIAAMIIEEALKRGFAGHVCFHYYNEPTLYPDFIKETISLAPTAKYLLWTNGDYLTQEIANLFDQIVVTDYGTIKNLPEHSGLGVIPCAPDKRASIYENPFQNKEMICYRPSFEIPIDCEGNFHLCCEDWAGDCHIGNIDNISAAFDKHAELRKLLTKGDLTIPICQQCTNPILQPISR